jgi:tRNA-dependent cyclodipeptide synthase
MFVNTESLIAKVKELFDSNNIRYISIIHSPAYSEDDIVANNYILGELIDGVLIRQNNKDLAMVVVPATRKISLDSLKQTLDDSTVNFVGKKEIKKLYPECEIGAFPPLGNIYDIPVFFTKEIMSRKEVTFYLGTRSHRIRLKTDDFAKTIQPQKIINVNTTARYHAEIDTVVPKQARSTLGEHHTHCMIGYSIQNKNFTTAKLVGIVEWVSMNFSKCTVAIGDSIYRLTLQIKGIDETQALNRALRLGREVIENESVIFESYSNKCQFELVLCSEIQQTETYQYYFQQLQQLFDTNPKFAALLHSFADMFVDRRIEMEKDYYDFCVSKSCLYIIEELAIMAALSKEGAGVFIYPGALNFLTEIIEGLHPDAPEELRQLVSVSLRLKSAAA